MPTIDFYVLSDPDSNARDALACRLIEKAYKNGHRIYIHTDTIADSHRLDEMLWTYRDDSFLPHHLYGEGPNPPPPIQIGNGIHPEKQRDILINLSDTVPQFFKQFNRILEIISSDATAQELARERFRFYRKEGNTINTHKLETVE